jgi:sugar/nucleoside kinase (ribokinase family)
VKRVLVVGEINLDLLLRGQAFPVAGQEVLVDDCLSTLGASSAIVAAGLARLGTPVAFLGRTGADAAGDQCVEAMQRAGVDVSRVARDPALRTGLTVSITCGSDRALVTFLGASTALRPEDVPQAAFSGFDHFHFSSFFLQQGLRPACAALFARARGEGLTTSLDPGFDPSERWGADLIDVLREADVFLPNEVELFALAGRSTTVEALARLRNGRTRTVVKLGAKGCATLAEDGSLLEAPAFPVDVVDTTGAGDSFDAGFLHAWLEGRPLRECLRWGTACGSLSTRGLGGTTFQPDRAEVEQLLASTS